MKVLGALGGSVVFLLSIGLGSASAAPANKNTITWPITCDGQPYMLTYNSGAASFRSDGATLVLMGSMRDGQWIVPLVPGQATKDLTVCTYNFFGHDDAIYVRVESA